VLRNAVWPAGDINLISYIRTRSIGVHKLKPQPPSTMPPATEPQPNYLHTIREASNIEELHHLHNKAAIKLGSRIGSPLQLDVDVDPNLDVLTPGELLQVLREVVERMARISSDIQTSLDNEKYVNESCCGRSKSNFRSSRYLWHKATERSELDQKSPVYFWPLQHSNQSSMHVMHL
jgi:hypothetical protein